MTLPTFWFVLLTILWAGFFVLEGFDFGVGMLHGVVARAEAGRRTTLATIGPFWDGNEVWLIVAAAGTFAAFPGWYATMFSALYPVFILLLAALIVRGIALEFRDKADGRRWRTTWDVLLSAASLLVPFLIGVALADLVQGVPIDQQQEFTGTLADLLRPYPLVVGLTFVVLCVVHGGTFLTLRTTGELRARSARVARVGAPLGALAVLVYASWTHHAAGHGWVPNWLGIVAVVAVALAAVLIRARREALAFTATAVGMAAVVAALFVDLYPRVMVSSSGADLDLTISNTAAGAYSLKVMTVVAAVLVPVVLAYVAWTYVVLRQRLGSPGPDVPRPRQPQPSEQVVAKPPRARSTGP